MRLLGSGIPGWGVGEKQIDPRMVVAERADPASVFQEAAEGLPLIEAE